MSICENPSLRETAPIVIRSVRPDEYDEVGQVTVDAYTTSYTNLTDSYLDSMRDVAAHVRDGEVWVAVDSDDTILGTVWVAGAERPLSAVAEPGETDFRQLAVAPAARGRGVGESLTRRVIDVARERGSHRVVMNSGPQMLGAHALYAKMGFTRLTEREGRIEVAPGRWLDLLAFGLDVTPAGT